MAAIRILSDGDDQMVEHSVPKTIPRDSKKTQTKTSAKTYPKTPERGIDKALPSLGIIYTPTQKVSGKLITIR